MFGLFEKEKQKNKKLSCGHDTASDISHNFGNGLLGEPKLVVHLICHKCDMHHYNGKNYTKEEWIAYVNDFSHDPESSFNKKKDFISIPEFILS